MDEEQLRGLAADLRAELPRLIQDDGEREEMDAALSRALDAPAGAAGPKLFAALNAHPDVRPWLRKRSEDVERAIDVPGDPTVQLGVLFVCPRGDEDFVRETLNQVVPPCSVHHIPLVRAED
jgi:hypothetical protein